MQPLKRLLGWFGKDGPVKLQPDEIVEAFLKRLSATRVNLTNVIDVRFSWDDPVRAAEIANAIGRAYITDQLNAKFEANRTATLWLQQRIKQLGDQAEIAERAVNAYKTNIILSRPKASRLMSRRSATLIVV